MFSVKNLNKSPIPADVLKAFWNLSDKEKLDKLNKNLTFDMLANLLEFRDEEGNDRVADFFGRYQKEVRECLTDNQICMKSAVRIHKRIPTFLAEFPKMKDAAKQLLYIDVVSFTYAISEKAFFDYFLKSDNFTFSTAAIKALYEKHNSSSRVLGIPAEIFILKPWLIPFFSLQERIEILAFLKGLESPEEFKKYRGELFEIYTAPIHLFQSGNRRELLDRIYPLLVEKNGNSNQDNFYGLCELFTFPNVSTDFIADFATRQPFDSFFEGLDPEKLLSIPHDIQKHFIRHLAFRNDLYTIDVNKIVKLLNFFHNEAIDETVCNLFVDNKEFFVHFFDQVDTEKGASAESLYRFFYAGLAGSTKVKYQGIDIIKLIQFILRLFADQPKDKLEKLFSKLIDLYDFQSTSKVKPEMFKEIVLGDNVKEDVVFMFLECFIINNDDKAINYINKIDLLNLKDENSLKEYVDGLTKKGDKRKLFLLKSLLPLASCLDSESELAEKYAASLAAAGDYSLALFYSNKFSLTADGLTEQVLLKGQLQKLIGKDEVVNDIDAALQINARIIDRKYSDIKLQEFYINWLVNTGKFKEAVDYVTEKIIDITDVERQSLIVTIIAQWIISDCATLIRPIDREGEPYAKIVSLLEVSEGLSNVAKKYLQGLVNHQCDFYLDAYKNYAEALELKSLELETDSYPKQLAKIAIAELFLLGNIKYDFNELRQYAVLSQEFRESVLNNNAYSDEMVKGAIFAFEYIRDVEIADGIDLKQKIYKVLLNKLGNDPLEIPNQKELFNGMSLEYLEQFITHYELIEHPITEFTRSKLYFRENKELRTEVKKLREEMAVLKEGQADMLKMMQLLTQQLLTMPHTQVEPKNTESLPSQSTVSNKFFNKIS